MSESSGPGMVAGESYPPVDVRSLSLGIHRQGAVIHRLPLFHVKHSMRTAR